MAGVKWADNSVFQESDSNTGFPQGYSLSPASFNVLTDDVLRNLDKTNISGLTRLYPTQQTVTDRNRPHMNSPDLTRSKQANTKMDISTDSIFSKGT